MSEDVKFSEAPIGLGWIETEFLRICAFMQYLNPDKPFRSCWIWSVGAISISCFGLLAPVLFFLLLTGARIQGSDFRPFDEHKAAGLLVFALSYLLIERALSWKLRRFLREPELAMPFRNSADRRRMFAFAAMAFAASLLSVCLVFFVMPGAALR